MQRNDALGVLNKILGYQAAQLVQEEIAKLREKYCYKAHCSVKVI